MTTVSLAVTAAHLTITVDILRAGGSVRLGVRGSGATAFLPGLTLTDCVNVTTNTTDGALVFRSGKTLQAQIGQRVSLVLEVQNAMVYTLGFV
jgi:hypothetical protein